MIQRWTVHGASRRRPRGMTLMELMVSLTIMGILFSQVVPRYRVALEQAGVDLAGTQLGVVWTAQRLYWIENRTYAASLDVLVATGLLDAGSPPGSGRDRRFDYFIDAADAEGFVASATRSEGEQWSGILTINESGDLEGEVSDLEGSVLLTPMGP